MVYVIGTTFQVSPFFIHIDETLNDFIASNLLFTFMLYNNQTSNQNVNWKIFSIPNETEHGRCDEGLKHLVKEGNIMLSPSQVGDVTFETDLHFDKSEMRCILTPTPSYSDCSTHDNDETGCKSAGCSWWQNTPRGRNECHGPYRLIRYYIELYENGELVYQQWYTSPIQSVTYLCSEDDTTCMQDRYSFNEIDLFKCKNQQWLVQERNSPSCGAQPNITCYQCQNGELASQKVTGTTCPVGWNINPPVDCTDLTTCYQCNNGQIATMQSMNLCPEGWIPTTPVCMGYSINPLIILVLLAGAGAIGYFALRKKR